MEQECARLLKDNHHVDITEIARILPPLQPMVKLLLAFFITMLKSNKLIDLESCPPQDIYLHEILANPLILRIRLPVAKLVASLIEKKLFKCE